MGINYMTDEEIAAYSHLPAILFVLLQAVIGFFSIFLNSPQLYWNTLPSILLLYAMTMILHTYEC